MIVYVNVYIYVCIYVSMSLSRRVVKDHSCGGMIAYAGEWHEEILGFMGNQVGRVVLTNLRGQYHVVMS